MYSENAAANRVPAAVPGIEQMKVAYLHPQGHPGPQVVAAQGLQTSGLWMLVRWMLVSGLWMLVG